MCAIGALAALTSPAGAQRRTGSLAGIVRDDAGAPIASVEVAAIKHAIVARTDSVGRFFLGGLPAGALDLTFRRLAFEPVVVTIDLPADDTTDVEVKLTVIAQRLTGVVVNDRAPKKRVLEGFEARRRQGIGYFVTRAQIEKRDPRLLSDMLRMIPGTILIAGDAAHHAPLHPSAQLSAAVFRRRIQASGMASTTSRQATSRASRFSRVRRGCHRSTADAEHIKLRTVLIWTRIPGIVIHSQGGSLAPRLLNCRGGDPSSLRSSG
jgi:hypothetical protein